MKQLVKRILRSAWYRLLPRLNPIVKQTQWYRSLFVDPDHVRYPDNVWYRAHDERNFDLVSLGSSGGKWAFDYSDCNIKAMNWANQPQTLIDDLRLFKSFHSILKNGGKVLIVIMPFSGLNKKTGVMDTLKYLNTLYWDVARTMPYFDDAMQIMNNPLRLRRPALKALLRYWTGREEQLQPPVGSDSELNPMSVFELEKDADRWMSGWAGQFGINDFDVALTTENLEGRAVRIGVMRELIDFIVERGYEPIYLIPPVAESLARRFTQKFKQLYIYDYLKQVERDVRLLDYSKDLAWQDPSLYFNSFFLNMRGRKLFTRQVLTDLGLIK